MESEQMANNNLAKVRAELDFSLDESADLIGCSKSMLSRIERGERQPSPQMRVRIARRLGVRVLDIFPIEDFFDNDDLDDDIEPEEQT